MRKDAALRQVANEVETIVAGSEDLWRKMKLVRDECFAHRSRLVTYDDVWQQAAIRPMDIYRAQAVAMEAANLLERTLGLPITKPHPTPGEEAVALLASLQAAAGKMHSATETKAASLSNGDW